jgi:DNA polymerase I-like protein with 3'-5' exonuclease and polymerase domains
MTHLADFLHAARAAGILLVRAGDRIRLSGPAGSLTPEIRAAAAEHKAALLGLLDAEGQPVSETATVTISGKDYCYRRRWAGERLVSADGFVGFDTETDLLPLDREIPRLALASASAGDTASCLIHPDEVGAFIVAHQELQYVCHHSAFDFSVVEHHLRKRGEEEARRTWWDIAATNRLHDSMLLEMLARLATDDSYPDPRDLATVAKQYARLEISKDDPFRMRYGEIIGVDWNMVEDGFFDYAVKDAIVTRLAYLAIRKQALTLVEQFGRHNNDILLDARERFGLLTEAVQVKKAIALAQITRNGMRIDQQWLRCGEADLRQRLDEAVAQVRALCPALYKISKEGTLICKGKAKAPSKYNAVLVAQLETILEEVRQESGVTLNIPLTKKTRKLSTSRKVWEEYQDHHPFLTHWIAVEELVKLLQFFASLQHESVHPHYTVLVRSGRTSCSSPNVQQVPRDSMFRQAFIASQGHLLLAVDYAFIESCTVGAHALHRYGWSDLADVIKNGADPHAHTAAMMSGVSLEEFLAWKNSEVVVDGCKLCDRYQTARQAAKPVNFGVPGGLGVTSLVNYARTTYKVDLTPEQAKQRRELLTKQIYRELDQYLTEDVPAILSRNLRAPVEEIRSVLSGIHLTSIRKILTGDPKRTDGEAYKETFVSQVWESLVKVNRNPNLQEALEKRLAGEDLARKVCQAGVATLTGRIRGRVYYSQARNTPFQGLAADGAALALFALVKEGFRVVGFVHDEVLVELPDEGGYLSADRVRRVEEILCREMEKVLVGGIPVAVEPKLSRRWSKKAGLVVKDGKALPVPSEAEAVPTSTPRYDTGSVTPAIISPGDHPEDQPP